MTLAARWARLRRIMRTKLWVRPALASLFSLGMALFALWVGRVTNEAIGVEIDEELLVTLFTIFASSMLSVATFTVSAIVTAASTASTTTTPRATRQIVYDGKAQTVLSAFIAAFIYSFIAIIALKIFKYGPAGRFTLFAGLIIMVVFVLVSFINWVDHAMKLGRQSTTIAKLREVTLRSLNPSTAGTFGAAVFSGAVPADSAAIKAGSAGYVSAVDTAFLQHIAEQHDCKIMLTVRPGEYCPVTMIIAHVVPSSAITEDLVTAVETAVERDEVRHEDLDIRFNVVNLAETADRALSSGINDPGTAIYILNVLMDVLAEWVKARNSPDATKVRFDRIGVPPLLAREVLNDAFTPIARDGAGAVEVGVRLQKSLAVLAQLDDPEVSREAHRISAIARELSDAALGSAEHRAMVNTAASRIPVSA